MWLSLALAYEFIKSCSSWTLFLIELQQLKRIFYKNESPENFIDSGFKRFLENVYVVKQKVPTVEKKIPILVFHFSKAVSLQTRTKLQKALKGVLNCGNF